jgi:hypothetical protein
MPAARISRDISGLLWSVWRKQFAKSAVQPSTELFEQVQADILLAHLDPMQGGFGHTQLPRKVPVWGLASSPSDFTC